MATTAAGWATTTDIRYAGDRVAAEVTGGITRDFTTDEAGVIRKMVVTGGTDAGTYLPTWNGHGDLAALWRVNADGTLSLAASVTYGTWGRPTVTSHNGIGDLAFRYLYVGASDVQWDNELGLGLLYMHARHYSPVLGRFLQPDPIDAEANLYAYAENSPVTKVDPDGTVWCLAGVLAGGVGVLVTCGLQLGAVVVAGVGLAYFSARTGSALGQLLVDARRTGVSVNVQVSPQDLYLLSKKGGQNPRDRIRSLEAAKRALLDRIRNAPNAPALNHWERQIDGIDRQLQRLRNRVGQRQQ